ncbi:MAG TPA: endonuclease III [Actinomycetota bacterium]
MAPARKPRGLTRSSPARERAPEIVRRLSEAYPDAHVALKFTNPLEMLVATILSAQCTDERVNMVTQGPKGLFAKYRKPNDYLRVPDSELAADIRPTGFFNNKTKSIRGAALMIVEEFGGRVPDTMEEILRLPGVARKTGNIVLGNSFGVVEGIAVDTHVRRVSQRLGFTEEQDPDKIERDLMALIPRERWFDFTYVLIDHGRAVCKSGTPRCEECAVSDLCPSSRV